MSVSTPAAEPRHSHERAGAHRDARALARSHRDSVRRRARRIRRSIAGLAVVLFALAFLVVYVQLASGHDPALVANAEKRATSTSAAASSRSSSGTTSASSESAGASSAAEEASGEASTQQSEGSTQSSAASAVTTSQS